MNHKYRYISFLLTIYLLYPKHIEKTPDVIANQVCYIDLGSKTSSKNKKNLTKVNCFKIIRDAEIKHGIPKDLLYSIAYVESRGRPWTVYANGEGKYFASITKAQQFIEDQKEDGTEIFFVGCMQLCMKSHGKKFKEIKDILDPEKNIYFAAKLLKQLYKKFGNWEDAVKYYNASTQKEAYLKRVMKIWEKTQT